MTADKLPPSKWSIELTKGRVAYVDEGDALRLCRWRWKASFRKDGHKWYAARTVNSRKTIYMHREIMGNPAGAIDHIDGDGLNNTRANLRLCNHKQNCANQKPKAGGTSHYKGVCWYAAYRCWRAQIKTGGKTRHLGYFKSEKAAADAYTEAARETFGDFARGGAA